MPLFKPGPEKSRFHLPVDEDSPTTSDLLSITKLTNPASFDLWQLQLETALKVRGLWRHVTGGITQPGYSDNTSGSADARVQHDEYLARLVQWDREDGMARWIVLSSVEGSVLRGVKGGLRGKTGKECYDYFCGLFAVRT